MREWEDDKWAEWIKIGREMTLLVPHAISQGHSDERVRRMRRVFLVSKNQSTTSEREINGLEDKDVG